MPVRLFGLVEFCTHVKEQAEDAGLLEKQA